MLPFLNKKIFLLIFLAIIVIVFGIFIYLYFSTKKHLEIIWPNGGEELKAGKSYQITWKSKKIGKVGILLFKQDKKESKWIVEDLPAKEGKYQWNVFVWEEPRQDYKIAILEYPWVEGNKIDYSGKFTISGPTFPSCDQLSIEAEWPFVPGDFPSLKKVFITKNKWSGNLGGLEGADKKCEEEAKNLGLKGNFKAFLGDDTHLATERLNLDGIFVEAVGYGVLPQINIPSYTWRIFKEFINRSNVAKKEKQNLISAHQTLETMFKKFLEDYSKKEDLKTCHRLLGKNFNDFFQKLSNPLEMNKDKVEKSFLDGMEEIWLGLINNESKKNCTPIFGRYILKESSAGYSFTSTCQNWTIDKEIISGFFIKTEEKTDFPKCYTPQGKTIEAVGLAGLSLGLIEEIGKGQFFNPYIGKPCNVFQRLLCIEQ